MIGGTYNGHNLNEYAAEGGIWLVGVTDKAADLVRRFFSAAPGEIWCAPVGRALDRMKSRAGRMIIFVDTRSATEGDLMIFERFVYDRGGALEYAGPFLDCTIGLETVRPDMRFLCPGRLDHVEDVFRQSRPEPSVSVSRDLFIDLLKLAREALENPDAPRITPDDLARERKG